MSIEPIITIVDQSRYCDKVHRTILFERDGYVPQIRVETYEYSPTSLGMKHRGTLALRVESAREVAAALLEAVDLLKDEVAA